MPSLIGTGAEQVPLNSMLGSLAYQNAKDVKLGNLSYSGTLTGGTGVINIGSNQIYKDATGNVGIGNSPVSNGKTLTLVNASTGNSCFYLQNSTTGFTATNGTLLQLSGSAAYLWNFENSTLSLGTNNIEYVRLTGTGDVVNLGTGATKLQEGTTAQRPSTPQEGMIRKNSTTSELESYLQGQYTDVLTKLSPSGRKNYLTNGNFMYNYPAKIPGTKALNPDSPTETRIDVCWKARSERFTGASSGLASYSFSTDLTSLPSEPGTRCKLHISCNSTEDVGHDIFTRVEGKNLVGGEVMTVSFWHKSTTGDSVSVSVRSPSTEDTWPTYSSGTVILNYTAVGGSTSWVKRSVTFTNPSGNTKGLQVCIRCITTNPSDTYSFTGFQLERGYQASSLEYLTQKQVQDDCYRYYYPVTSAIGNSNGAGFVFTAQLPTQMRPIASANVLVGSGYYAHDGVSHTGWITPTSTSLMNAYPNHALTGEINGGTSIAAGSVRQLYGNIAIINCEL